MTNYINNKEFYESLCVWVNKGREMPVNDDIVNYLLKLISRIASKRWFNRYSFLDDMKSEAMLHCLNGLTKYDIAKENPYGYFTTCIHNAFFQYIKKENRLVDFKFHLVQDMIDTTMKNDRSTIVGYNRNPEGDVIDEEGDILTDVAELRSKGFY